MSPFKLALLCMFLTATSYVGAASAGARATEAKLHAPYPDTAQGLRQELKDMRELARKGRSDQLRAMVMDLEIPDARAWYLANFGTSGSEAADNYESPLTRSQERLENQMIEFAREDGYFSVKKQDSKKVFPSLIKAHEVFLATWENIWASGEDPDETPFGYFLFLDGKFRWDSTITWVELD
jgi:hypothetical protein